MAGAIAFLVVWLPYIASTYRAERLGDHGIVANGLMVVAMVMIWPAAKLARSDFGLKLGARALAGFAGLFVVGLVVTVLRWLLSAELGFAGAASGGASPTLTAAGVALAMSLVPSLAEDVLTRGFPLFAWKVRPALAAIVFSAAMYTANHLWRMDWGVTEQIRLFAMGAAYASAALATRSLWAAVGLHLAGNTAPQLLAHWAPSAVLNSPADRLVSAALYALVAVVMIAWAGLAKRAT